MNSLKVIKSTKLSIGSSRRWVSCEDDAMTFALGSAPEKKKIRSESEDRKLKLRVTQQHPFSAKKK